MSKSSAGPRKPTPAVGRKRDPALDEGILEAAIQTLAEVGFDSMTMDAVAARAKTAKTSVYRRWMSKAELVRDALIWMSRHSVETEQVPDTGNLRDDLLAVLKPYSIEHSERKVRVLAGLGSFYTEHKTFADEAKAGIFGPWMEVNRQLMKRAIERGELPAEADIALAGEIIVAMNSYRTGAQNKTFDRIFYATLLDTILLPGLKTPPTKS